MARTGTIVLVAGLMLASGGALGLEVKLTVSEPDGVGRAPAAVATGVPFAKGAVKDLSKLTVTAGGGSAGLTAGKAIPAQFAKTVSWDDGSVRWALLDTQVPVPAGGKVELVLTDAGGNPAPAAPVKVTDGADGVTVSTGPLQFTVSKVKPGLFQSVLVNGKELVKASAKGLLLLKEDGGEAAAGAPAEVKVETPGPMRAVVLVRGTFPDVHRGLLGYTARITACAGQSFLKIHFWLENRDSFGYYRPKRGEDDDPTPPDTMRWFLFKGMSVNLDLGLGEAITASCEGAEAAERFRVFQGCKPMYTYDTMEFTIGSNAKVLKQGGRTDGIVGLKGSAGAATVAIRDFWQNGEKAIELDGKTLKLWLWPAGGRYPRFEPDLRGLTGGCMFYDSRLNACIEKTQKTEVYNLQGSTHKGHELVVDFSGRESKEAWAELARPLAALATGEYYASTEALPGFVAPPETRTADKVCNRKLDSWMRMIRSAADPTSSASVGRGREVAGRGQFGWMDFGDICAGGFVSPGGWAGLLTGIGLRTGDPHALRLATEMARHRIDVDTIWSEKDLPEIRGLVRNQSIVPFHSGRLRWMPGPGEMGLQGLTLHYAVTGEPKALECIMLAAERLKELGTKGGGVGFNAEIMTADFALQDLTADKAWLEQALARFRTHIVPVWKQLGPFLHDPYNQIRSQDYWQEDAQYFLNIPVFCELHRRTGDEAVLKMLQEACDQPLPHSFDDAALYATALYAYVGMATKNQELLGKAMNSFIEGFPLSKCPPVFLPGNYTWPADSAGMLRSGEILQYAAWKTRPGK